VTTTTSYLRTYDAAHVAFLLVLDNHNLAFTTADDVSAVQTALAAGTSNNWTVCYGGLEYPGQISGELRPFDAEINVPTLELNLVDYGDVLISAMYREGDTSVATTELTASIDSDDGTINAADTSQFTSSGTLYIGSEEIAYTGKTATSFTGCTRGHRSIWYTNAGTAYRFGVPHTVEPDVGTTGPYAPRISQVRKTWLNAGVTLYLIHRDPITGTWSAPGSADAARVLWVGRVKNWRERDGRVTLHTYSVTERLQTTLLSDQYKGVLTEGIWLTEDAAQFRVTASVISTTALPIPYNTTAYVTLPGTGGYQTHQEVVDSINAQLLTWFNASPGTYFPSAMRMDCALHADGVYGFHVTHPSATALEIWTIQIHMSRQLWLLLGWTGFGAVTSTPDGHYVVTREMSGQRAATEWHLAAEGAPKRIMLRHEGANLVNSIRLTVTSTSGTSFDGQAANTIPVPLREGGPEGFLRIGGKAIVPVFVSSVSGDETTFGICPKQLLNSFIGRDGYDADARNEFGDFLMAADDGGEPVTVEQVWCEAGELGEIMLSLMSSTGTIGYNHATYDRHEPQLSVGIPWTMIDYESILSLGRDPYLLLLTGPTPFQDLLESALNYKGKHLITRDGKLTVVGIGEEFSSSANLVALTEDNKAKAISGGEDQVVETSDVVREPGIINRVTLKYHRLLDGKPARTITVNARASQTDFGQTKSADVDAFGIYDESGLIGATDPKGWARDVAAVQLAYFSRPTAYVERSFDYQAGTRLYPGARVSITDNRIVSPVTGTRGVSGLLAWCVEYSMDWRTGVGRGRFAFSPELSWVKLAGYAPSARVDDTANTGGYTNGYDAALKSLKCYAHAYSDSTADVDVASFEAGDEVRVVHLSYDDLHTHGGTQPTQSWNDTINAVDAGNNSVTLTTGLSGFPANGPYVLTYRDAQNVDADQRTVRAFLAAPDTLTTGHSTRDAYLYGGTDADRFHTGSVDYSGKYRRRNRTAADRGEPFSVHTIDELLGYTNAYLGRAACPVLVTQCFQYGAFTSSTAYVLVWGPVWVPLRAPGRTLVATVQARIKRASGGPTADADGVVRVSLSRSLPRGADTGQPWSDVRYLDGPDVYGEMTFDNAVSTTYQAETVELAPTPTQLATARNPGIFVTLDAKVLDADDRITLASFSLREKVWG
jgi:hypothetical protein